MLFRSDQTKIWGKDTDYIKVIERLFTTEEITHFLVNSSLAISENLNKERDDSVKNTINEAKKYILEHFKEPELSVEMVCEHLHISPTYFSTIFKRETGQTYISYLTELRLNKAVELLTKTTDKTYIIAGKVGYAEPNYFSYVFKKRFGISPTKYQRR